MPPASLEDQAFNIHAPPDNPQFAAAHAAAAAHDAVAEDACGARYLSGGAGALLVYPTGR